MNEPESFDVAAELQRLKAQTQTIRKRPYTQRKSKLDKYKGELLTLYDNGASGAELVRWLKAKRIKCVLSTVLRYIEKNRNGPLRQA